jgi:NADPH2:quinone reductase
MTAMIAPEPGGPDKLVAATRPIPTPGAGEILIRVAAAGVNRPDVMQRMGLYPPPKGASDVLGLEAAGTVAARGPGADRYAPGAPVMALVAGGAYAEYVVAHQDNALPVPPALPMIAAGCVPETYFTVWTNVFDRGGLRRGETLLVHGGSSGIGVTAILLGKAFGATVIVTAGSAEKCEACQALGADAAINYREADFVAETRALTGGRGCDVILDMVGGDYAPRNIEAAAAGGRIVVIAVQGGASAKVDLLRIMLKRLTLTGSTLRIRPVAEKAAIAQTLEAQVLPLFAAGEAVPPVFATFPLRDAAKAHALMESSRHVGKIALLV